MLPGYGFSPFPDFHPHLYVFRCRGESPSMWIPGSGESHNLSESKEGRPLLHPIHPKHVAVCQQETLAFIELQQPAPSKLNGLGSQRRSSISDVHSQPLNGIRQTLNELNDMQKGIHRTEADSPVNVSSPPHVVDDVEVVQQNGTRTSWKDQIEKPRTVTTVCRPLHAALSLPLSVPLSSLYTNRESWEAQEPYSSSSPEFPGPDACQPQRRTSQGSFKEKSIRKLTE